jgi:hypothetical protein
MRSGAQIYSLLRVAMARRYHFVPRSAFMLLDDAHDHGFDTHDHGFQVRAARAEHVTR